MKILDELYYEFTNKRGSIDTVEVQRAFTKATDVLKGMSLEEPVYEMIEGSIIELSAENEKQGFVNGFKYAMQIASEIFGEEGVAHV